MKRNEIKEWKKMLNGCEWWTDAFGDRFDERVCAMVEGDYVWHSGKKFKPTQKEWSQFFSDYVVSEYGSRDALRKELESEFGGIEE